MARGRHGADRRADQKGPTPAQHWAAARRRARDLGGPPDVMLILDYLVRTHALNRHLKLGKFRKSYGRHSEAEREWDRRRRRKLVDEGLPARKLIQLPNPEQDGIAEAVGISRRSAIRAMRWMEEHDVAHGQHEEGTHPIHGHARRRGQLPRPRGRQDGERVYWERQCARGGCKRGGIGLATIWWPGAARARPPDPPVAPDPPPEAPSSERPTMSETFAQVFPPAGRRARGP